MATTKQTARALLRANRQKYHPVSWRTMSRYGYSTGDGVHVLPGVNPTTLCRFAKSKGSWLPKDDAILKLLGVYKQPRRRLKYISEMKEHELLAALHNRVPCPAPSPAIIKAFRKLGWLKRVRVTA